MVGLYGNKDEKAAGGLVGCSYRIEVINLRYCKPVANNLLDLLQPKYSEERFHFRSSESHERPAGLDIETRCCTVMA